MDIIALFFIAFGLAMDAFAVSITSGITIKHLKLNHALRIAGFFGGFQAIMPFIGWIAGLSLINYISGIDHWIAFALLAFIGCKMIYEATRMEEVEKETNPLNLKILLLLSIATSIDALAIGLSFAILKIAIVTPMIVIGTITFVLSFLGTFAGNKLGHLFENRIEIAGGLILIAIGTEILLEHIT
jgi:putative Mn2+ efflux pump MntP